MTREEILNELDYLDRRIFEIKMVDRWGFEERIEMNDIRNRQIELEEMLRGCALRQMACGR